jgi:hypothetical protein
VILRTAYPAAHRLAEGILGSAAKAQKAVLRGLANAAQARTEFAGQTTALAWVLGFVEKEILDAGRRWGLKRRAVRRLTAAAAENLVPAAQLAPAELAILHVALAELDSAPRLPPAGRFGELAWILGLATLVLIGLFRFNRAGTGETPPPLFPTTGPPTPTVVFGDLAAITDTGRFSFGWLETGAFAENEVALFGPVAEIAPFSPIESQNRTPNIIGSVNAIALSPDDRLAATRINKEVVIWTLPEGEYAYAFRIDTWEIPLAFANRTNLLASGKEGAGSVAIWSIEPDSARLLFTLEKQDGSLVELAFSPDDRHLLIATSLGLWIWELSGAGEAILVSEIRQQYINALSVSPDGRVFASDGLLGKIEIRSLPDGRILHRLDGPFPTISALAFSPDGKSLAAGTYGHSVVIWNFEPADGPWAGPHTGALYPSFFGGVQSLEFSPDGRYLDVSNGGGIVVWDLAVPWAQAPAVYRDDRSGSTVFTSDGELLVMAGIDGHLYLFRPGETDEGLASESTGAVSDGPYSFFLPLPYDAFPAQQVLLIEDGQPVDPTTPLAILNSISTREFSSRTGLYTPIPESIPEEAVFLGQRNSGARIVTVVYELPLSPYQTALLTVHLPTGVGGPELVPEDFPDRRTGASAEISRVSLGEAGIPGELTIGGWVFVEEGVVGIPVDKTWVVVEGETRWVSGPERVTLRWEQGGILFELTVAPVEPAAGANWIGADELIELAGVMIDRFID